MDPVIQEYVNLLYEKYDSLDMTVPTAMGITTYFHHTLNELLSKKRQNVLFLLPNMATANSEFNNFCNMINVKPENGIFMFHEFSNGSFLHFLPSNQVQKQLWDHCDIIILGGLYFSLDKLNEEFIEKVKKINKRITINCTLREASDVLFDDETHITRIRNMGDLKYFKQYIRKYKLDKIKEEHERRKDRSVSMAG